jgi:tRNA A-37 threonylcarbamoyl transferase component Bud32
VPPLDLRLRVTSPGLLALPWRRPLADWDVTTVAFRDIPVGTSRHLVRFVEADDQVWALKALPHRIALAEYDALRTLEDLDLPAVRAAGVVRSPMTDEAVLVTRFLDGSWQYRRLLLRVPISQRAHRARLLDAVVALVVELHRNGIHWGDGSLANALFKRDGQVIGAWLVDAETAEIRPQLSDGQRQLDLDILTENLIGGLLDVAARRGELPAAFDQIIAEVDGVSERYGQLWELLHDEPVASLDDVVPIEARLRRLNELGFAVDEVRLADDDAEGTTGRLTVCVAGRRFHCEQLRALTGIDVSEGRATILLLDLRAHLARAHRRSPGTGAGTDDPAAVHRWRIEVFEPGMERAHAAVGHRGDPVQAYCDLLEVRWLLSEKAGADVGDETALAALAARSVPGDSAAELAFVDLPTAEMPALPIDLTD